jgi:hypothetical protein
MCPTSKHMCTHDKKYNSMKNTTMANPGSTILYQYKSTAAVRNYLPAVTKHVCYILTGRLDSKIPHTCVRFNSSHNISTTSSLVRG